MKKKFVLILLFFVCYLVNSQNLVKNSTGSFTYKPTGDLSSKTIRVFYRIPDGDITKMPILFSFHGVNRNADDYRDYWISMANANKFMVFAPEFSDADFSTGDAYNLANIFDDGDNPSTGTYNPKEQWTFSVLDPIFEKIKTAISGSQQKYNGWGHSAGAQFLQRFVMYLPNSKLDIAICANAGWYTVPEFSVNFPYGLNKGQLPINDLKAALAKKLIVHLGTNDTDPNSAGLRHNSVVDNQQGLIRLVRGRYFFTQSQGTAQGLNTTFNWEKVEVSGVDHDAQLMANAALQYVLQSTLSVNNFDKNSFFVYPNPVKRELFFDNSKLQLSKIEMYSIQGQVVAAFNFNNFINNQKIDVSKISTGTYVLKGTDFIKKIIKE